MFFRYLALFKYDALISLFKWIISFKIEKCRKQTKTKFWTSCHYSQWHETNKTVAYQVTQSVLFLSNFLWLMTCMEHCFSERFAFSDLGKPANVYQTSESKRVNFKLPFKLLNPNISKTHYEISYCFIFKNQLF